MTRPVPGSLGRHWSATVGGDGGTVRHTGGFPDVPSRGRPSVLHRPSFHVPAFRRPRCAIERQRRNPFEYETLVCDVAASFRAALQLRVALECPSGSQASINLDDLDFSRSDLCRERREKLECFRESRAGRARRTGLLTLAPGCGRCNTAKEARARFERARVSKQLLPAPGTRRTTPFQHSGKTLSVRISLFIELPARRRPRVSHWRARRSIAASRRPSPLRVSPGPSKAAPDARHFGNIFKRGPVLGRL